MIHCWFSFGSVFFFFFPIFYRDCFNSYVLSFPLDLLLIFCCVVLCLFVFSSASLKKRIVLFL